MTTQHEATTPIGSAQLDEATRLGRLGVTFQILQADLAATEATYAGDVQFKERFQHTEPPMPVPADVEHRVTEYWQRRQELERKAELIDEAISTQVRQFPDLASLAAQIRSTRV